MQSNRFKKREKTGSELNVKVKGEGRNKSRFANTPYPKNSVNLKCHDQDLWLLRDKEATIITMTELTEAIGIMTDKEGTVAQCTREDEQHLEHKIQKEIKKLKYFL